MKYFLLYFVSLYIASRQDPFAEYLFCKLSWKMQRAIMFFFRRIILFYFLLRETPHAYLPSQHKFYLNLYFIYIYDGGFHWYVAISIKYLSNITNS